MTIDQYAQLEQQTGIPVIKKGDIYWREVRPFFYRPLLPFETYPIEKTSELFPFWNMIQFPVEEESRANSALNMIVIDDIQAYSIETLHKDRRRDVRKAIKNGVTIKQIHDAESFIPEAYPVYLSFYGRTHYGHHKDRNERETFAKWVRTLTSFEDVYLLGAYLNNELTAILVYCIVDRILVGKSLINSEKSIHSRAPDLLLHYTREEIAKKANIDLIFTGMLLREQGINNFKLWRGAKILSLPAYLKMPFPAKPILKALKKAEYEFLIGKTPESSNIYPSDPFS